MISKRSRWYSTENGPGEDLRIDYNPPIDVAQMTKNRIVGIDYGIKRVGLAMADPLGMFAQPFGTHSPHDAIKKLEELHESEGVRTIIIGWPLQLDGTEGTATEAVSRFIKRIRKSLKDVEIIRWDERFTSEDARDQIRSGLNPSMRKKGRGRIDTAAAGIILEEYLKS